MKKLLTVIKILVLLSAAGVAATRFIAFKYEAAFSQKTRSALLVVSILCAAVLILCGIVWVLLEKQTGKRTGNH